MAADWPPRAPLTSASVVWFTDASVSAWPTKLQEAQGVSPPAEQNSWVVLDMPIERRTILPDGLGFPDASSGCTADARAVPLVA